MRIAAFMLAMVLTTPLAAPASLAQPSAGPGVEAQEAAQPPPITSRHETSDTS